MRSSIDGHQLHTSVTMMLFLSVLSFIQTSPIFWFDYLCSSVFIFVLFNYSPFLVRVRLLRLCLVLENVKEIGKEIERKNVRKKK